MTNEDAIKMLNTLYSTDVYINEALDLAINALEEAEDWHNLKLVCANDGIVVYKVKGEEE